MMRVAPIDHLWWYDRHLRTYDPGSVGRTHVNWVDGTSVQVCIVRLACKADFVQVFVFWFGYTSKEIRVSMAVFMGTAQDQCPKIASIFWGRFIRDKVGINLLLRPLLWAFKNSRYILQPNMPILHLKKKKQYCSSFSSYFKVPKNMKKNSLKFFAIFGIEPP